MIEDAIRDFNEGVSALKKHLEYISTVKKTFSHSKRKTSKNIIKQSTDEKIFEYKTLIISLYGSYEHCIESMIQEYIRTLSSIVDSFDGFPEPIKKDYIDLWKVTHTHLEDGHSKYSHLDDEKMVENLYETIKNRRNILLPECYVPIGGNYRHKVVKDTMSKLGLGGTFDTIKKYSPLANRFLMEGKKDLDSSAIYSIIDDLVDRRNEIAHGGTIDNIISEEEFKNILDFVSNYIESIGNFLQNNLVKIEWELKDDIPSFSSENIFNQPSVVMLKINGITIKKGDTCIISSQNYPQYQKREILDLHIETADKKGEEKEIVDSTLAEQIISIKVDMPIKGNYKFIPSVV